MDWLKLVHSVGMLFHLSGTKRAMYLKKHAIMQHVGDHCMGMFRKIPLYPKLISIGDNVWIASNVSLITHDVIHKMLNNRIREEAFVEHLGCIDIQDNVFVGANSTILPNVTIGSNVIIAAGSLVNKSIPGNGVYGGVPVKYICPIEDLTRKRKNDSSIEIVRGKGGLSEMTVTACWNRSGIPSRI